MAKRALGTVLAIMLASGCTGSGPGGTTTSDTDQPAPDEDGWTFYGENFSAEVGGIGPLASGHVGNWTAFGYNVPTPGVEEVGIMSLPAGRILAHVRPSPELGSIRTLSSSSAGPDSWRLVGDFQRSGAGARFTSTSVFALAWEGGSLRALQTPLGWQAATTFGNAFFDGAHRVVVADLVGVSMWTERSGSWTEERLPGVSNLWNGDVAGNAELLAVAGLDTRSEPSVWVRRAGSDSWQRTALDGPVPVSFVAFQVAVESENVTVAWSHSGLTSSSESLRIARWSVSGVERNDIPAREYPDSMDALGGRFVVTVPYANATRQLWRAAEGAWERCVSGVAQDEAFQVGPDGLRRVVARFGWVGVLVLSPSQCPPGPPGFGFGG